MRFSLNMRHSLKSLCLLFHGGSAGSIPARVAKLDFSALLPCKSECVHNNCLIGFTVGVVTALMAEDVNLSVGELKAPRIIAASIRLIETFEGQPMPRHARVLRPVNAVCRDVEHRPLARGEQFRMTRVLEGRRMVLLDCPGIALLLQQPLPARLSRIFGFRIATPEHAKKISVTQLGTVPFIPDT